ncbi:MAG: MFS transporter, partial [Chloroflexi bacterium]|nr:MFS transporter [Chloroflexota bacterium]
MGAFHGPAKNPRPRRARASSQQSRNASQNATSLVNRDTPVVSKQELSSGAASLLPQDAPPARSDAAVHNAASLVAGDAAVNGAAGGAIPSPAAATPAPAAAKRRHFHPHVPSIHLPVRVHTLDSLRYRNYRLIWATTVFASGGFWLQQVIVGWFAFELTGSAFITSLAMGLDALPVFLAGPLGGLLVDAFDRRKLLVFIFGYQAAVTAAFGLLVLFGVAGTPHIFGYIFLMGLSWVIVDPARIAMIPNIVPKHNLVNAFALNSLAFSVTRLAAPAVGGLLIALIDIGYVVLVEAALQLTALGIVFGIRMPSVERTRLRLSSAFSRVMEGARYIKGEPILFGMLFFSSLPSVFVMPFVHGLMPVYAAEIFDVGSTGLGLLFAAIGVGATLGTLLLASLGEIKRRGMLIVASLVITIASMALFSQIPSFTLAFVMLVVLSMGTMAFFATSGAIVHSIVTDELRGRVSGLFIMTWGVTPIGSVIAGVVAEEMGAPASTLVGSGIMFVSMA